MIVNVWLMAFIMLLLFEMYSNDGEIKKMNEIEKNL